MEKLGRCGFSMVELLVTCSVLATLVGVLLPAIQQTREAARAAVCMNRCRGLATAVLTHEAALNALPALWELDAQDHRLQAWVRRRESRSQTPAIRHYNWVYSLLPHMELESLRHRIGPDQVRKVAAKPAARTVSNSHTDAILAQLQCPSIANYPCSIARHYVSVTDGSTQFNRIGSISYSASSPVQTQSYDTCVWVGARHWDTGKRAIVPWYHFRGGRWQYVTDGLSYTGLTLERSGGACNSFLERGLSVARWVSTSHPDSCHLAMCSGAVRKLDRDMDPQVLRLLLGRSNGKP